MTGSSGGGGGGSNTVTQTQQIPDWQKDFAQANESIASSIASRPYQAYQGQMIAGLTPQQQQGMQQTQDASTAYQPYLNAAKDMTAGAVQPWTAQTAQQYMNPYAMAALAPQMQQLQLQQGQNQLALNKNATQSGAYGDARHGVAQGMNNFYGNMAMNDLTSQGMNTAYNTGLQAFQQHQATQLAQGQQMAALGGQAQSLGLAGGNANFNAGSQQQQLNQQQLSSSYQNWLQQQNYPIDMLNLRIASLANSPYNTMQYQTMAPSNATAMNIGAFGAAAGGLGSLLGGSGGASSAAGSIFGSDIRLKKNIRKIGETMLGIPVYIFNYLWDTIDRVGVMAHEVEQLIPEAVIEGDYGIKFVNYDLVR